MKKGSWARTALIVLFFGSALILLVHLCTKKPVRKAETFSHGPQITLPPGRGTDISKYSSPMRTREYVNPPTHVYQVTVTE